MKGGRADSVKSTGALCRMGLDSDQLSFVVIIPELVKHRLFWELQEAHLR